MKQISKVAICIMSATLVMTASLPAASAKSDSEQQQRVKPLTSNVQNFVQESLSQTFLKTSANTSATLPRNKDAVEEVADKDIHIGESEANYEYSQYNNEDITVASSMYVSTAEAFDFTPIQEKAEEINLEEIELPNRVYSTVLKPLDNSGEVVLLQKRLMKLGFMEDDNPTGFYGSSTQNAIEMFQRSHNLAIDGVAGSQTLDLLFSGNAKLYTINPGDRGNDVQNIQVRLQELEYYWGAFNGIYDDKTLVAMKLFQRKNGLYDDGVIGQQTMDKLFSPDAVIGNVPKPTPTPTPTPKPTPKPVKKPSSGGSSGSGGGGSSSGGGGGSGGSTSSGGGGGSVAPLPDGEAVDPNVEAPADGGTVEQQPEAPVVQEPEPEVQAPEPEAPEPEPEVQAPEPEAPVVEPVEPEPEPEPEVQAPEPEAPPADTGSSNNNDSGSENSGSGSNSENNSGGSSEQPDTKPDNTEAPTPKPDTAATPIASSEPEKTTSTGNSGSSEGDSDTTQATGNGTVSAFLSVANAQSGKKYKLGGNGPNSFDCSGFVYYSLNNSGKKVPRLSAAGYYSNGWSSVSKSNWQVGDLLFFYRPGTKGIGHVGIYVGGNKMIHASTSEGKILTTNLGQNYWVKNYAGARRVF